MREFWAAEAKAYNNESIQLLRDIERIAIQLIAEKLEGQYGKNWVIQGLPRPIYDRAKKEADDQNYEAVRNGAPEGNVTIWECVTLAECKTIATSGTHWSTLFDDVLTRPEEHGQAGTKESKTGWLQTMTAIAIKLKKPSYSVSTKEFELIKSIYEWLSR